MDDAMIGKLLQTYGAQPTIRNANAARSFYATNPEIAEKRAMGMRGSGVDDNSDIFGAQLDKFIQASEPAGRVEVGQPELAPTVQAASRPTRKSATALSNTYPNPNEASGTPNNPGTGAPVAGLKGDALRQEVRGGKGFGLDDILTALLGITSAAGAAKMGGAMTNVMPNDPRLPPQLSGPEQLKQLTYQPKLEEGGANARATAAEKPTVTTGDPALTEQARKQQLQAEIDAENADAQRLQNQIQERNAKQKATADLAKSARNATGRR